MTARLVSFGVTLALLAASLPFGMTWVEGRPPPLFGAMAHAMLLPHFIFGDWYHWRKFPLVAPAGRWAMAGAAAAGLSLFLVLRQSGAWYLPVFFTYFVSHFWKDIDDGLPSEAAARRLKQPAAIAGVLAFGLLSSGLVTDPAVVRWLQLAALVGACGWLCVAAPALGGARRGEADARVRVFYGFLTAAFLLTCAWITAAHPAKKQWWYFLVIWHYAFWYARAGFSARRLLAVPAAWPAWARRAAAPLTTMSALLVLVHALSAAGLWAHAAFPQTVWLGYVFDYDFQFLRGAWSIAHITWNWLPPAVLATAPAFRAVRHQRFATAGAA